MERIVLMAKLPRQNFVACGIKFECLENFDPDGENEYYSDYFFTGDPWKKIAELQKLKFVGVVGVVYSF